jgi:hypothetical protein
MTISCTASTICVEHDFTQHISLLIQLLLLVTASYEGQYPVWFEGHTTY